jgi:AcrR family transcriptional regulator
MREPSQIELRNPRRRRGHARVQALLAAAGGVFADKGYDAATMTEIAARAGSAIGSLYQFFPTKAALAQALVAQQLGVLAQRLDALAQQAPRLDIDTLSRELVGALVAFRADHPSFARLIDSPGAPPEHVAATRKDVRERVAAVLAALRPMTPTERQAIGWAVQQVMKAAVALQTEALTPPQRRQAFNELTRMLACYLRALAPRPQRGRQGTG